jgi:SAM-dependent methyltransferase
VKCRHCAAELTLEMVDLGESPPSNLFHRIQHEPETIYPLRVLVCTECWLAQTDISRFTLGYDELFAADYPYFSSTSASFVQHAKEFVERTAKRFGLGENSLTVEIGSNDGYLLQWVKTPCYGVEPTATGDKARDKGIRSVPQFFTSRFARDAIQVRGEADLIIANNVLAHVPDINDFVQGIQILLKPTGVASFEFPHLLNLVRFNQFDTVYHEHYSYLSLTTLVRILKAQGLRVFDVEKLPTHGGSLRVYACKDDRQDSIAVTNILQEELMCGVTSPSFYTAFQARANKVKDDFLTFLLQAKAMRRSVVGYGAAAKGNTLLNYAGVKTDLINYVVDETPSKQGKYLPGNRLPVLAALCTQADYVLILPWNFKREIMDKLAYIRAWGGKFVTAIPQLEIL